MKRRTARRKQKPVPDTHVFQTDFDAWRKKRSGVSQKSMAVLCRLFDNYANDDYSDRDPLFHLLTAVDDKLNELSLEIEARTMIADEATTNSPELLQTVMAGITARKG